MKKTKTQNLNIKDTNPKDEIGSMKLPLHLFPVTAIAMGCIGMLNGLCKYGRMNFRVMGIRASVYVAAALRHIFAWLEGEEDDPVEKVPHLAAALACLAIIVDARAAGKFHDDRNVRGGYIELVKKLTPLVGHLKQLHSGYSPKHWTIADNATLENHEHDTQKTETAKLRPTSRLGRQILRKSYRCSR